MAGNSTPTDNEAAREMVAYIVEQADRRTAMSALTAFLLARISEDEARYSADRSEYGYGWQHMLAECAARRTIVGLHGDGSRDPNPSTLKALALPYATHDDWRQEWGL